MRPPRCPADVRRRTRSSLCDLFPWRFRSPRVGKDLPIHRGVNWPDQPVESIPPSEFRPELCSRPTCEFHRPVPSRPPRFRRDGSYTRKSPPHVVPRFRCLACGKRCSQQTFSTTYYLKRPELLEPAAAGLFAGSAHRQIARSLGCAPTTVTRLAARLGRHALLVHALALESAKPIAEPVVYDDFETFAFSQDQPFGMGTAVGHRSWFVYSLQFAPHRQGGRPRRRRSRRMPAHRPGSYRRAFQRTLDLLLPRLPVGGRLELISDGHPGYRAGLRHHPGRESVQHRVYPNPKRPYKGAPRSAEARLRDEQMFPVDLLHMLMRHSQAPHRRETIAIGRRHNALMERGFLMMLWRNFIKRRSERVSNAPTPAMLLGLTEERWSWRRALARRLFPSRIRLPAEWRRIYFRQLTTPAVGRNSRHELVHAA